MKPYRYFRDLTIGQEFLLGGMNEPRLRKTSDDHGLAPDGTYWQIISIELCLPLDTQLALLP